MVTIQSTRAKGGSENAVRFEKAYTPTGMPRIRRQNKSPHSSILISGTPA